MSKSFTDLIHERRSIRSLEYISSIRSRFDSTPVEIDKINRILEKIILCPNAGNQQVGVQIIIVIEGILYLRCNKPIKN